MVVEPAMLTSKQMRILDQTIADLAGQTWPSSWRGSGPLEG
jgi:hypothetical protein